jgi:hypothetical protein
MTPEHRDSLGELLEFRLSEHGVGEDLYINGSGLITSYGIFGAPGSGKTVLLLHLLKQVLAHSAQDPSRRYGALILDPKAALIEKISKMARAVGREKDLVIINTELLNNPENPKKYNVIDCNLESYELGSILVLAGLSAGISASDPFWFQEWSNVFASTLSLLQTEASLEPKSRRNRVGLKQLMEVIFEWAEPDESRGYPRERKVERIARNLTKSLDEFSDDKRHDLLVDIQQIERFYQQDYVGTIQAFMTKAYGMFRRSRYWCYSDETPRTDALPFYEDIIQNGKIILVSISPSEPVLAKTLCTLIKCLFQRTILSRQQNRSITNHDRPLVIACDEYSEIASEVPGQSMGDGQFLALAREYGCMAILATQSVNVLQASSLKETWRSVFSNFAAKFYMRLVDNETAEEATKLAGQSDWKVYSSGGSLSKDGHSINTQRDLRERPNLPSTVLTQVLKRGEAVVIGSLDAGASTPGTYFLRVPKPED